MLTDELTYQVLRRFPHAPTRDQRGAVEAFAAFLTSRAPRPLLIMRGAAGTGKTALTAAMVRTVSELGARVVLMAPTGRAAKVLATTAAMPALTIHRAIYRQKAFDGTGGSFSLAPNMLKGALFVADESSMIANASAGSSFGSGCLLDDLVQFVYSSAGCRLLLIGDAAQLPPVGEDRSPALDADFMRGYGLDVAECALGEVLRQSLDSGILANATRIRAGALMPKIRVKGFADVAIVPGGELIESLASSYSRAGVDDTIVITRSNKRANIYNKGIRASVLGCEDELSGGDMLMVVKNNYHWLTAGQGAPQTPHTAPAQAAPTPYALLPTPSQSGSTPYSLPSTPSQSGPMPSFLANGDMARVVRVRRLHDLYGLRFATLTLAFPDYEGLEETGLAVLDSLHTEATALTREQNDQLFAGVCEDYADTPRKADRMKQVREDAHYNALQIKFGYAITCHKAQGGQWAHVYIDQGYMPDDAFDEDYAHWLYTAFTRATQRLFLVNWPERQTED